MFSKVIVPVSKTNPNPINKNPEIFSISNNFVLIFEKNIKNRSIAIAEIKNGIANPAEYIPSKPAPVITDELVAAIVRIPAKIGPIQGVQPAPKAMPTINGPNFPEFLFAMSKLICLSNLLICIIPAMCNPKTIKITPPILSIHCIASKNNVPINDTVVPNKIKQLNKEKFNNKIVTLLEKATEFWIAEEYHQKYIRKKKIKKNG